MNYVLSLMKEIIGKRKLIWDLGKADFRKRFVGSYFGVVWMFIQPIVTVSIYAVVFGMGFKSPPPIEGFTYVEWLVPGIVPWFFFSESVNSITNCLQEYNYLVKKVVFKVEILPIIKLISCLLVHAFFVVIMFGMYLIIGRMPSVIWFQLVYYSLAASLLALGIGFGADREYLPPVRYLDDSHHVPRIHVYRSGKMGGSAVQAESFLLCGGRVQGYHAHRKLVLGTAHTDPLLLGLYRGGAFAGT